MIDQKLAIISGNIVVTPSYKHEKKHGDCLIINGSNDGAWISYTSDGESTQSAGLNVLPWDLLVLNVRRNFLFPHTILPEFGEFAEFCFGEIDGNCNIVDGNIDNRNQKNILEINHM